MGLEKVKEGAALIKESRKQLGKLENEFEKVKADIEEENDIDYPVEGDEEDGKSDSKDIPFKNLIAKKLPTTISSPEEKNRYLKP